MQSEPIANNHQHVTDLVIQDMRERKVEGIKRYGVALQPLNGRDALQDAYEEAMDLCQYLKQAIIERDLKRMSNIGNQKYLQEQRYESS